MGYRSNYDSPDTPGHRTFQVAGVAGIWGAFGWFIAAIIAEIVDVDWIAPWIVGFVLIFLWGHFHIKGAAVQNQGTYAEMAADPDLNTQDWDLHWERLNKFGHSIYNGETEFMGPRGGIYTITASDNPNYR